MTRVLAVDIGGQHVKFLLQGETERRRFASGEALGPERTVARVLAEAAGWEWDVVSIGVPAPVVGGRIAVEPVNLGEGWAGFDFAAAFGKPTKVINDAAMQALGSYRGSGRMLFLGLGTGLGASFVSDGKVEPMELGHFPFRKKTWEDYVGEAGRLRLGRKRWEKIVHDLVEQLRDALAPDDIVIGGGNVDKLKALPEGARLGDNANAFLGGFALWRD